MLTSRAGLVLFLGILTALPPLSIDISLPGLPEIATALHATSGQLQWTLSAFILAFGLGQLIVGPLSDRHGRRPVLVAGLAAFAIAGLACALVADARWLIALRFAQGLGACAGTVCAGAIAQDVSIDRAQGVAMQAFVSAVNSVAPIVAPMLGALVLATLGWRSLYGALGIAGALLVAAVAMLLPETSAFVAGRVRDAYRRVLTLPGTVSHAGFVFASFGGYFALISTSPFVLVSHFHLSTGAFAIAFACNAAASLAGAFLLGRVTARVRLGRLLALGTLLTVLAGIGVAVVDMGFPSVDGFVLTMMAYGFAFGFSCPAAFASAIGAADADSGVASGILGAAQMIGGSIGSATVAALPLGATASAGFTVACASLLALLFRSYAGSAHPIAREAETL